MLRRDLMLDPGPISLSKAEGHVSLAARRVWFGLIRLGRRAVTIVLAIPSSIIAMSRTGHASRRSITTGPTGT